MLGMTSIFLNLPRLDLWARMWSILEKFCVHLRKRWNSLFLGEMSYRYQLEQAPGVGDGQGSLACCCPWGCKESDTTEQLNWTEQAELKKGRVTSDQIANVHRIIKKQGNSRKSIYSASLTMLKPLTVWIVANCGKFLKKCKYQTTLPVSWETSMWVKKQLLGHDMEQWIGSK